jgi:peptidoglycan/xylan/chitin deacetylase (PgdA/CDA1 family)
MYHRITKAPPDTRLPDLWVPPFRFQAQLAMLKRHGWRTITAEELALALRDHRPVGRKRFVITIDDGARDGWTNAAPILEKLGMHATYCVVAGKSRQSGHLSFRMLRKLREAGHEIANHSLTHADLSSLSLDQLRHEVYGARRLIENRVGHAPLTLCYPYGRHDRAARRVVAAAGHLMAFTTEYGTLHSTSRPMRSPRVRVNGSERPSWLLARM